MTEDRSAAEFETERLTLHRPSRGDLDELFAIESDPRVWTHYPSRRRIDPQLTRAQIDRWRGEWMNDGLGMWTVQVCGSAAAIGYGGCYAAGGVWHLGYRLAPEAHGRGYATELVTAALQRAQSHDPSRPVVARLLEHNTASQRVVLKLEMELAHRALDKTNPDPSAVRLIYSDRTLTAAQLATIIG